MGDAGAGAEGGQPDGFAVERKFHEGQLHEIRELTAEFARKCGAPPQARDALLLVASELVVNAVRHGGGRGTIRLWRDAGGMWCQIVDDGPGFADPRQANGQPGPLGRGGRGLWIVRTVAAELSIDTSPAGTRAIVRVRLQG